MAEIIRYYTFSTQPDSRHNTTTLLKADVLNFYLTLDLLQSACSDLVSKWRGHTVATTFLLRGHCQTCAGCPETIFLCFNRTAPHRISTRYCRFPGARDARKASWPKRLCPCMWVTFRARILIILSRSVTTTNNDRLVSPDLHVAQQSEPNWTVRAFLQLTLRLSNDFAAAWLTFTFPQIFAVAATLKSIDYNVAMTFILNNNNNNNDSHRVKMRQSFDIFDLWSFVFARYVWTWLGAVGNYDDGLAANLLPSQTLKEFVIKSTNICQSYYSLCM